MIRCNHCGKLAPTGALSCQNCGMPLASDGMGMVGAGQPEQSELPAWLESLRAHERPVSSGLGDQPFSMADVVDENSMPLWMRQNQPGMADSGNSDAFPALSETPKPGSGLERPAFPDNGLTAGSLIDEQSLPSWMRSSQEGGQPGPGQNVSANSLVDQRALPPWMKELGQMAQPQPGAPEMQYGLPAQTPVTPPAVSRVPPMPPQMPPVPGAYGQGQPPTILGRGFGAGELIDQQALPGWMTGAQGPGPQPPSRPVPTGSGFGAGELIDQQSLPRWMQDQQGQDQSKPASVLGMPVGGSGQMMGMQQGIPGAEGLPASTLLDIDSLPAWMQEGAQGGGQGMQSSDAMSAGSLIDMNAMPAWLRNSDNPQQSARGGQGRAESMRVPSRPRNDPGTQEQSEVAANVFASMLGVSASAPVIPGQGQEPTNNLGVVQGQPMQPMQPFIPGWQSPQQPTGNPGVQPQAWQLSGPTPPGGAFPMPNGPANAGAGSMQPHARMGEMPPFTGFSGMDRAAGPGSAPGTGGRSSEEAQAAETKKRGFFDSIRDFFFK